MAIELQLRDGTTSEHASFTGAEKEVTVDTDKQCLVVHDGLTQGGFPLARENMSNVSGSDIPDIDSSQVTTGTFPATRIDYNNSTSNLLANDVQSAIDEVAAGSPDFFVFADNYSNLQDAFNEAVSSQKTLLFTPGATYTLSSPVVVTLGDAVGLKVDGRNAFLRGDFTGPIITVQLDGEPPNGTPIIIENIGFVESTVAQYEGILFEGINNSTGSPNQPGIIRNIFALPDALNNYLLKVKNFRNLRFEHCSAKSGGAGNGAVIITSDNGNFAGDCVFYTCEITAQNSALGAGAQRPLHIITSGNNSEARGLHFTDCYIYQGGSSIDSDDGALAADIFFTACQFDEFTNGEIALAMTTNTGNPSATASQIDNVILNGCYFQQGNNSAIDIAATTTSDNLKNISILNNFIGGVSSANICLNMYQVRDANVHNCVFENITTNNQVIAVNDNSGSGGPLGSYIISGNRMTGSGSSTPQFFNAISADKVIYTSNLSDGNGFSLAGATSTATAANIN